MGSLGFPFSFSQPPKHPPKSNPSFSSFSPATTASFAAALTATFGIGSAISHHFSNQKPFDFFSSSSNSVSSAWASLSLASSPGGTAVDSKTGVSFPTLLKDTQRLLGIGIRKKSLMGLKNIDVYAYGVYADELEMKDLLGEKVSASEMKESKNLCKEILDQDVSMTVRLQIVYGRLSIRSVRSAFEESVGNRLQKFSGSQSSDNKELLQRFTSQFKDEYKLPRGSVIDISRERGYILRTTIDGKEVGSIPSKLLCSSILDLYIGEDSFDSGAKEEIETGLISLLQK